jgi:hypothetical protein
VVDVDNPAQNAVQKAVVGANGGGRQVIQWNTDNSGWIDGYSGKIGVISSKAVDAATDAESFIVYNQDMSVFKRFAFPSPRTSTNNVSLLSGESAPAKLALSENYAIAGWREYTGNTTSRAGLLIYSLTENKAGNIPLDVLGVDGALNMVGVVTKGNYAIITNNNGETGVYRIDASGDVIKLVEETAPDDTREAAWLLTNGAYVLETSETGGWLRIWRWNEGSKPTQVGDVMTNLDTEPYVEGGNNGNGTVRAITFASEDINIAYHLDRSSRAISKINLANATKTPLFKFAEYTAHGNTNAGGAPTTQSVWNVQKETHGANNYYVLGGGVGSNNRNNGLVFVLKNPPEDGTDITEAVNAATPQYLDAAASWTVESTLGSVRSTRSLKDSAGNIYYVAKVGTAAPYPVRVVKLNR